MECCRSPDQTKPEEALFEMFKNEETGLLSMGKFLAVIIYYFKFNPLILILCHLRQFVVQVCGKPILV